MDFDTYAASMKEQGFGQVVERVWEPLATAGEHTHAFDPPVCLTRNATALKAPPTGWVAARLKVPSKRRQHPRGDLIAVAAPELKEITLREIHVPGKRLAQQAAGAEMAGTNRLFTNAENLSGFPDAEFLD
jgi:hypothetical protein